MTVGTIMVSACTKSTHCILFEKTFNTVLRMLKPVDYEMNRQVKGIDFHPQWRILLIKCSGGGSSCG